MNRILTNMIAFAIIVIVSLITYVVIETPYNEIFAAFVFFAGLVFSTHAK